MTKADHSTAPARVPFSTLPEASGLYDPRFEHDACGVSFVVDVKGRATHETVDTALGALCNLDHRGASGAEANTGDGAGILLQVPDRFLRGVAGFDLPPAGSYGVGMAFLPLDPTDAEKAMARVEAIVAEEGLRVLGWRTVPIDDSMIGPTAQSVIPSFHHLFVDDPAGATGIALDRKLFVVRKRCEHEITNGASTGGPRRVLPVAVVPHPRLQGDAHHAAAPRVLPRPARRAHGVGARARAQPLLHEHVPVVAARAPVPLHRAQRRDQHGAGQPQLAARARVDDEHAAHPGAGARVPDHHAGRVRHRELRRVPRAAGARRPADLARRADDDPGGVGEPRDDVAGEARLLPVPLVAHGAVGRSRVDRVHRRHRDRRGARPQRPPAESLLGHRRRPRDHGERDRRGRRRPRARRQEGPAAAGSHVPRRHREGPHRRRRGDQGGARGRASVRGVARPRVSCTCTRCPTASTSSTATSRCSVARRRSATPTRSSSCSSSPMARTGGEALGSMGTDTPGRRALRSSPPAVRLLPAGVRAGHEPAARRHPRGAGHVAVVHDRRRGQPARPAARVVRADRAAVPDHRQRRARQAHPHRSRRRPSRVHRARDLRPLPRRRWRRRAPRGARPCARGSQPRDRAGQGHPRALRPRLEPRVGADPVAAPHVRGAPSPHPREDAHEGRPRRRDRRRARGAPHGAARSVTAPARSTRTSRSRRSRT